MNVFTLAHDPYRISYLDPTPGCEGSVTHEHHVRLRAEHRAGRHAISQCDAALTHLIPLDERLDWEKRRAEAVKRLDEADKQCDAAGTIEREKVITAAALFYTSSPKMAAMALKKLKGLDGLEIVHFEKPTAITVFRGPHPHDDMATLVVFAPKPSPEAIGAIDEIGHACLTESGIIKGRFRAPAEA